MTPVYRDPCGVQGTWGHLGEGKRGGAQPLQSGTHAPLSVSTQGLSTACTSSLPVNECRAQVGGLRPCTLLYYLVRKLVMLLSRVLCFQHPLGRLLFDDDNDAIHQLLYHTMTPSPFSLSSLQLSPSDLVCAADCR